MLTLKRYIMLYYQYLYQYPTGLSDLRTVVLSNSELEISWSPPARPNGRIDEYILSRRQLINSVTSSWSVVYSGLELSHYDSSLTPGVTYQYQIEVGLLLNY